MVGRGGALSSSSSSSCCCCTGNAGTTRHQGGPLPTHTNRSLDRRLPSERSFCFEPEGLGGAAPPSSSASLSVAGCVGNVCNRQAVWARPLCQGAKGPRAAFRTFSFFCGEEFVWWWMMGERTGRKRQGGWGMGAQQGRKGWGVGWVQGPRTRGKRKRVRGVDRRAMCCCPLGGREGRDPQRTRTSFRNEAGSGCHTRASCLIPAQAGRAARASRTPHARLAEEPKTRDLRVRVPAFLKLRPLCLGWLCLCASHLFISTLHQPHTRKASLPPAFLQVLLL